MTRCSNCFQEYDESYGMCPFCGYSDGDPAAEVFCLAPGTEIAGRYIIGKMVGLGGFGITYKAWDKKLDTVMAIKEYYPSGLVNRLPGETSVILVASKREREFIYGKTRFLEEARNMAKFNTHPNIVNVFDFFEANNTAYIVMEFLEGKTLSQILQKQNAPLPYDYCVNVASDVCKALRAIHKENILHRDVSPDNIMICSNGVVKLFDFGAARFSAGIENRVTVVVKPGFAPPEQYDKVNRQDPRTDIYALGATLYYAMTGTRPEESTNRKIEDTLEEPSKIEEGIPQSVSTAIMRAMAVEQQYRFSNVDEFEKALKSERKVETVQKVKSRRRMRRSMGIAACMLVILGAAAGVLYEIHSRRAAVTLPDAELTIWYIEPESDAPAKKEAFEAVIQTFTEEYSNVSVAVEAIPADGYAKALLEAGTDNRLPDIFESTGLSGQELSALALPMEFRLDESLCYAGGSPVQGQYPTSLVLPMIYVNSTHADAEEAAAMIGTNRTDYAGKESAMPMFEAISGEALSKHVRKDAKEAFLDGELFVYLGDTSDYFDIQNAMPGEYTLVLPAYEKAAYAWGNLWSISTYADSGSKKAAVRLLEYFNSDLAQDFFYIQNQGDYLPINRASAVEFAQVYNELSGVVDFLEKPRAEAAP